MSALRALLCLSITMVSGAGSAGERLTYSPECLARNQSQAHVELLLKQSAERYNINPDLLWASAKTESNLKPCIISPAGAIGVMQLMPGTAEELGVIDPFDAEQNIDAGARYLATLIERFRIPQLYLAAYNAGPGAVTRKRYMPNYRETKRHVRKIMRAYMRRTGIRDDYLAVKSLEATTEKTL